ncbi:valine--tRNA ligase [Thermodesulfobacterium hydrogeniphilum]|uniref:valine--tRNA ligase n=1 Tax=Thermodesulfobacterium hydrogeniphilum TaxID=161156 RepID=UPI00056FEB0A|nr:valine--tRNA ligase [Thermodesulfobacterium hydrogeniphilum]
MEGEFLEKSYNPKKVEEKWYKIWEEKGYFEPTYDERKPKFSMVIPPPNVTGVLHIGHALNNTIQDVLARYKRMDGYDVLWIPGTDHAGIATQNVVEREIAKEGLTRHDLGREKFLERVWKWKEQYGNRIIEQLKKLGASCSWSYQRFTMDEGLSRAVKEVFVRLWEEGLIYRGDYIINWCPRCQTALADLEVEFETVPGKLWYLKYPFEDGSGYIIVATTRPETMLGDTAVAVNPEDDRYKHLIGKNLILPLVNRVIPIIADKIVDPEFGTGAVKVTPAHDFTDFEIAKRHNLPFVKVINEFGRMTEEAGAYAGLDRFEARKKVVEDLKAQGLLEKEEDYQLVLGHCYRCNTVIEPLISKQWFVSTKPLAQPATAAVEYGFIKFVPENWTNLYYDWMRNIRDWCISRQIWWGHRIPVWYCNSCGEIIVSKEDEVKKCPNCGSIDLKREEDVLDTWFSSALWPFSTMGWPEKNKILFTFYPTSVLVTSFDIIFFWVARMIMMGIHFMGQIPFEKVYIHALVRDEKGQKMSKSRGNVIDPLEMIEKYGTDALRFTLVALAAQGRDIKLSEARIEGFKHFINKVWNASRFVLMNLENYNYSSQKNIDFEKLPLWSKWIISELQKTIKEVREKLDEFEFDQAAMAVYHFFWDKFCDWYLEASKIYLKDKNYKDSTQKVLLEVLKTSLKLLHPFIPFITEEIWQYLLEKETEHIIIAKYPEFDDSKVDKNTEKLIQFLQEFIVNIRNIKSEYNLTSKTNLNIIFKSDDINLLNLIEKEKEIIKFLAKIENIVLLKDYKKEKGDISVVLSEGEIFVNLKDLIDVEKEIRRLTKEREKIEKKLSQIERKLQNKEFLEKAPKEVVEKEKNAYNELKERLFKINHYLKELI